MQPHIHSRTLSICSFDRLACLHRLSLLHWYPSSVYGEHSHFRRLSDVTLDYFGCLVGLTYCDKSCTRSGTFSDAHWQGCRRLRHPSKFSATLLDNCCCGFSRLFVAAATAAILGKPTHPPHSVQAPHVGIRHNFGSGYDFPIQTPLLHCEERCCKGCSCI